ncbi:MAG: cysteine-rich CWC family protein [Chlorobium sp.]|jgi:hypothetical protein|uniref:cysteine-rich CWC family protein n=1 Tax=Chlorobium sp. TaxID=1095 RepID=UPI0025B871F1|nr:cysteine-rich CWC family protein [Chlorobium sp.]MCF8216914.1 cysteine-rich CWC family protein [Chlorobium sp.]MCF8271760.1 cysteine-rich CWC family protein [Chlorobium sp.]MCF8288131.1 cysteine-rich CWC family protein [Chlorobium sp.]MCF8291739.1 cysteine-rich CWC family protein [Chlorobium sp.]MCF8385814.1 cysteine-rich CWC family protein [Chlorobium sp.]
MAHDHASDNREARTVVCPICGAEFICSRSLDCWCARKSIPFGVTEYLAAHFENCVCSSCLDRLISQAEADGAS